MDLARVIGTVTATHRAEGAGMDGVTLLLIQPVDAEMVPQGPPLVATDATGRRGVGETVFFVASGDAVFAGPDGRDIASDAAVLGIVDSVTIHPAPGRR